MMLNILFSAPDGMWQSYETSLTQALVRAKIDAAIGTNIPADKVDYIVYAPNTDLIDFTPFTRTKAVLSLWAGVESIASNKTLTQPLCRMVDESLEIGMREWVAGHVMRHHLGMDAHIHGLGGVWDQRTPPLANERKIAILGLGVLGQAAAKILSSLGFQVSAWSRTAKQIGGIECYHGAHGLEEILKTADICVLLLPSTTETENTLNEQTLSYLPQGAIILNPGRGALIDDSALINALDSGHIAHATLDAFRIEPLPKDHIFWTHPNVTVTPHIAAETRPKTASGVIVDNIVRCEAGHKLLHLVDRNAGY